MATRIDVGGGVNEPHTASLDVTTSVYGKPLASQTALASNVRHYP